MNHEQVLNLWEKLALKSNRKIEDKRKKTRNCATVTHPYQAL